MKDPAFLFYTSDFLTGIADLDMEERGQYISLLCLQHQKGHLTNKMIRLCVGNAAADVMHKFRKDAAGLWYNERLEKEIEKRAEHSEKQRQRALEGWEKRKKNSKETHDATAHAAALPLENEDVNENDIENKDRKEGVEEREGIIYPWDSKSFKTNWLAWRTLLRDKHDKDYFNLSAEQSGLMNLSKLAKTETEAIEILQQSLRNGWKDLFKLKTENGTGKQTTIEKRDQSKRDTADAVMRHYAERLASEEGRGGI